MWGESLVTDGFPAQGPVVCKFSWRHHVVTHQPDNDVDEQVLRDPFISSVDDAGAVSLCVVSVTLRGHRGVNGRFNIHHDESHSQWSRSGEERDYDDGKTTSWELVHTRHSVRNKHIYDKTIMKCISEPRKYWMVNKKQKLPGSLAICCINWEIAMYMS